MTNERPVGLGNEASSSPSRLSSSYFLPTPPEVKYDWTVCTSGPLFEESVVSRPPHAPRYHPLRSPFSLIQEDLYPNPWALLVATVFLNVTRATVAKPPLHALLRVYPTPELCAHADEEILRALLQPLGLQNRRAARLIQLSRAFLEPGWTDPRTLPGIGDYGGQSWDIFCGRDSGDGWKVGVDAVGDKELKKWVRWRTSVQQEEDGMANVISSRFF
ncbi:Methyl-CpG-binding domain protein 4 [Thoreauomyces humboldtii]|nr:Methyl-CpG-binding domain protein 4 [Thoreauomyces humboldtii]